MDRLREFPAEFTLAPRPEAAVEPSLAELLAMQAYLKDRIRVLTEERNGLPRSDKVNAHRLLAEITRCQAEVKDMRPAIVRAREVEERREQHSLWCACIVDRFGQAELAQCFEWMKAERRRRRLEAKGVES